MQIVADEFTFLAITHRKSLILSGDQIVQLIDGPVVMEKA